MATTYNFVTGGVASVPHYGWTDLIFITNFHDRGIVLGGWSLCTEEQFYIITPLVLFFCARHNAVISLRHHVAVARLARREIADHVETLACRFQIRVGETRAVGHREIGARHFNRDDANLGIARGDLGGGKVAGRYVVVIPEAQVDHLP